MTRARLTLSCMAALVLAGCSSDDHEDLRVWMRESTKDLRGNVPRLPQVKPYEPVAYAGTRYVDPFRSERIAPEKKTSGGDNQPDLSRPKEPLEGFPVESLKYVGSLKQRGRIHALIVADGALHQVRVGSYMGQDFGRVVAITDTEVQLRELVQDAAGDWAERRSALKLQEREVKQ